MFIALLNSPGASAPDGVRPLGNSRNREVFLGRVGNVSDPEAAGSDRARFECMKEIGLSRTELRFRVGGNAKKERRILGIGYLE